MKSTNWKEQKHTLQCLNLQERMYRLILKHQNAYMWILKWVSIYAVFIISPLQTVTNFPCRKLMQVHALTYRQPVRRGRWGNHKSKLINLLNINVFIMDIYSFQHFPKSPYWTVMYCNTDIGYSILLKTHMFSISVSNRLHNKRSCSVWYL